MQQQVTAHLQQDPILRPVVERVPFPAPAEPRSVYGGLLGSIISQQLSTKVADVIRGRFLGLYEDDYPSPERLLSTEMVTLRSVGLSRQKAGYLQNVADFFDREKIKEARWATMADEEIIDYLTQIKGVGRWTVQMILMFTLHRPDVFAPDDYGIQKAMVELYGLSGTTREIKQQMKTQAAAWSPYRTYACYYLWRHLDG